MGWQRASLLHISIIKKPPITKMGGGCAEGRLTVRLSIAISRPALCKHPGSDSVLRKDSLVTSSALAISQHLPVWCST